MKIISHRGLWKEPSEENSLEAFASSQAAGFGLETDLRSFQGELLLSHDAITEPSRCVRFEQLIQLWKKTPHLPLFLNIKEDGLLPLLHPWREQLLAWPVVFFDMSVPQLVQFSRIYPPSHLATRYSEYEKNPSGIELCSWLWVDGFQLDPELAALRNLKSKNQVNLALVSPELHSRDPVHFWNQLKLNGFSSDHSSVLCTDRSFDYLRTTQ